MLDSSIVSNIIASAGAGTAIMVVLFLTGMAWTKSSVDEIKRQRDAAEQRAKAAEEQRDEALKLATDKMVPLLANFVSVTTVLIPLLQQVVASQEHSERHTRGR